MNDEDYMKRALELARRGEGRTSPNPMVGAVIVKDGRIIGEGYHREGGGPHAERNALAAVRSAAESEKAADTLLQGASMYVTLEPCCHCGKTPPARRRFWRPELAGSSWGPGIPIRRYAERELKFSRMRE